MVRERKKIRVASNKMRRDCAMCALSGGDNVRVVGRGRYVPLRTKKDDRRRKRCDQCSVSTLFHYSIYNWDGKTTEDCGESTHSNIRNVIFRVVVADVLKAELTIESHEPASEAKKELCEWWMYVEVIFP